MADPQTVTLTEDEFNALARHTLQVEVLQLRAARQIADAMAQRQSVYQTLAAAHGLPLTCESFALNDATRELTITPRNGGPP
jgi:hypothetical protein